MAFFIGTQNFSMPFRKFIECAISIDGKNFCHRKYPHPSSVFHFAHLCLQQSSIFIPYIVVFDNLHKSRISAGGLRVYFCILQINCVEAFSVNILGFSGFKNYKCVSDIDFFVVMVRVASGFEIRNNLFFDIRWIREEVDGGTALFD